ncbi:MAG: hypothetical protein Q9164_005193 [Protoblastenia rupestris]
MALKSPLIPSPSNSLMSAFSPYSDSPTSPQRFESPINRPMSSEFTGHLHAPTQSSPLAASSPSDIADPSPIATSSNGTDTTDIDDTAIENDDADATPEPPKSAKPGLELETANAAAQASKPRSDEDEQPSSVIHAPQGFDAFVGLRTTQGDSQAEQSIARQSPPSVRRSTPIPSQRSEIIIVSPPEEGDVSEKRLSHSPASPPPLLTSVPPVRDWSATPRAHTRGEAESEAEAQSLEANKKTTSRSSSRSSSLAGKRYITCYKKPSTDVIQTFQRHMTPNKTTIELPTLIRPSLIILSSV